MATLSKILVIRNDKLGDFTLCLPVFHYLKLCLHDSEIHALVPDYTRPVAELCSAIDKIIIDRGPKSTFLHNLQLVHRLRSENYDAVITLFSTTRTGFITWLAGIPYRLAPATKLAQLFYNHRLVQRRSRSEKPESEYNLELAARSLTDFGITAPAYPSPPFLSFHPDQLLALRNWFCLQNNIDTGSTLVFIHGGSGGSANNLSLEQYAELARQLSQDKRTIVLTCGPDEEDKINVLSGMLNDTDVSHVLYHSNEGLNSFVMHIAIADLFIAGSTGPLHLAGALNVPTVGFYTRRRSATALRWQTLNSPEKRLAITPPATAGDEEMSAINISNAASQVLAFLNSLTRLKPG